MENIIKLIATQLGVNENKISENSRFIEDLNADSLDMVEMLLTLEEVYSISISDEESINIKSVKDIFDIVESKKK